MWYGSFAFLPFFPSCLLFTFPQVTVTTSCHHVHKHVIAVTSWKRQVMSKQGPGSQKKATCPGNLGTCCLPSEGFSWCHLQNHHCVSPKCPSMPGWSESSVLWPLRREMQGGGGGAGHSGYVSCHLLILESQQAHRVAELIPELLKTISTCPTLAHTVPSEGNTGQASGQGKLPCGAFTKGIS